MAERVDGGSMGSKLQVWLRHQASFLGIRDSREFTYHLLPSLKWAFIAHLLQSLRKEISPRNQYEKDKDLAKLLNSLAKPHWERKTINGLELMLAMGVLTPGFTGHSVWRPIAKTEV